MTALMWKKFKEIRESKIRLFIILIFPLVYFILLTGFSVPRPIIVAYFSLACMLIGNLAHWNIEDLVHSETLLTTPLTPFKIWFTNCLMVTASGFICAQIYLVIISLGFFVLWKEVYISNVYLYLDNLILSFLGFSLIATASVHHIDFSKSKQYLTSIFSLFNFIFPFTPFLLAAYFPTDMQTMILVFIASVLLLGFVLFVAVKSKREKLVLNIQKLSEAYEIKLLND